MLNADSRMIQSQLFVKDAHKAGLYLDFCTIVERFKANSVRRYVGIGH